MPNMDLPSEFVASLVAMLRDGSQAAVEMFCASVRQGTGGDLVLRIPPSRPEDRTALREGRKAELRYRPEAGFAMDGYLA